MASYETFECMSCGLVFTSSGPHLFFHDQDQRIQYLPHPWHGSIEQSIEGTIFEEYCLNCKAQSRFIAYARTNTLPSDAGQQSDPANGQTGQSGQSGQTGQTGQHTQGADKKTPLCEVCGGQEYYRLIIDRNARWSDRRTLLHECPRCHQLSLQLKASRMT